MKLLSDEESTAHRNATLIGCAKGAVLGAAISTSIFTLGVKRWPAIRRLNTSIKTAMCVMPPLACFSVWGELASLAFDEDFYQSEKKRQDMIEAQKYWNAMDTKQKCIHTLSTNRYSILGASWVGSMWGSWALVNRDPIMTKAQKIVQARMYAQALTIVLLIGTVYLSMYEEEHGINHENNDSKNQWKRIIAEAEAKGKAKADAEAAAAV
ncbi:hypothetical protein BABINDRAFT_169863 [Babjeviella inositovora NRRL Y-12698]|uniref:HIG1 domain-containing protein n=1 Tax=Babjeviella inositovora NRRL Y-12698 TaxID=984486 RepID=A0A1E3QYD1_9ASCO|nr:uncharacterized protein BABINDRAFT_169863 [Babjeviella inositovora NRRL Y-12698]ODQ82628.1 hypothetical protein BABINDRAFT_169863 [Babjeviella inositovora NRRL Y-12698]